jgi:hypothetical protein
VTLLAGGAATAAPAVQPHGKNDAGGFLNILPPGQNGHADAAQVIAFGGLGAVFGSGNAPPPPHARDQLDRYANLVYASPTLDPARLTDFYKDAGFGVRPDDVEHRYGPRGDVTILRDRGFGVPHIYGKDRNGAMFGAGYAGAEDRLFLMDVLRHVGRAKVSSFVGGSEGNRALDREQWRIAPYTEEDLQRQYDLGDDVYGAAGKQVQDDVRSYVEGINKYICEAAPARAAECAAQGISSAPTRGSKNGDTPAQKLPGAYAAITPNGESGPLAAQPQLWKVTDVIATASLVGGIFGKGGGRELESAQILRAAQQRFGQAKGTDVWSDFRSAEDPEAPTTANGSFPYQVPPATPAADSDATPVGTVDESEIVQPGGAAPGGPGSVLPPLDPGTSNALVLSGAISASGRPLAVFGPQTGYTSPQLLMELDIHAPASRGKQGIDARGAAFAGVNLYVQLGRGRDYAWSATSAGQDNTDTFALELCDRQGPALSDYKGYLYRGQCLPFERLERTNRWVPNAGDSTPPGTETLAINRTKLGLEIARGRLHGGTPVVYVVLRSTYMHEADSALGFVDFNDSAKMGSPAGFQDAAYKIGFTFNWFYANGSQVAYFNSGNNPERPAGPDPNFPVRACPGNTDPCKYEWIGWDPDSAPGSPNMFVSEYTPASEHPQGVDQTYFTSWNNKQAKEYRAADDNFSFGPVHRSQPLDDRIQAGGKFTRSTLVDAMEDAATVDLRGDKVLPFALRVLGDVSGTGLEGVVDQLRAWEADGAHRRDKDPRDGHYEHRDAIKVMDAWWPRWIDAQFKPPLGDDLHSRLMRMIDLDDEPNANGGHTGSAYIAGWYGYAQKDLRSILGDQPAGAYSRQYCGDADGDGISSVDSCRQVLLSSLRAAVQAAADEGSLYRDDTCESDDDPAFQDPQLCFDAIEHSAIGAITQPLINWQNRPTFQQVVEVGAR